MPPSLEGENYHIFTQEQANEMGFPGWVEGKEGFWTPSSGDVLQFQTDLRTTLEDNSQRTEYEINEIRQILEVLDDYRYQIYGIVVNGEQHLYVSFFPGADWDIYGDSYNAWREQPLLVSDGGFWFWNIQYSPSEHRYFAFESHGYA